MTRQGGGIGTHVRISDEYSMALIALLRPSTHHVSHYPAYNRTHKTEGLTQSMEIKQ